MNVEEYALMARVEDTHWWYRGLRRHIRQAWTRYGGGAGARLLDVGCGTGATMARLFPDYSIAGLDLSPHALTQCRRRSLHRLVQGSVLSLPLPDETFDGALLMDVLYHRGVEDKAQALVEIGRTLKPGAILILNVPAYQWLYSTHDAAIHTDKRFTKGEIVRLLREAALDPLNVAYWNTFLFPPIAAVRLLKRLGETEASDLEDGSEGPAGPVFNAVLALEHRLIRLLPMPFGLSVFAVARKP